MPGTPYTGLAGDFKYGCSLQEIEISSWYQMREMGSGD